MTITELRSMQVGDLHKEVRAHRTMVQKMRLQIHMGTEKDTGRYRREKTQLARMCMVLGEKEKLNQKPKTTTLPAAKKKTSSKRSS